MRFRLLALLFGVLLALPAAPQTADPAPPSPTAPAESPAPGERRPRERRIGERREGTRPRRERTEAERGPRPGRQAPAAPPAESPAAPEAPASGPSTPPPTAPGTPPGGTEAPAPAVPGPDTPAPPAAPAGEPATPGTPPAEPAPEGNAPAGPAGAETPATGAPAPADGGNAPANTAPAAPPPARDGGSAAPAPAVTTRPAQAAQAPSRRPVAAPRALPRVIPRAPALRQVFERSELGFDGGTLRRVSTDLAALGQSPARAQRAAAALGLGFWLALAALAILIGSGLLVERLNPRWWRAVWVRVLRAGRQRPAWKVVTEFLRRLALPLTSLALWSLGGALAAAEEVAAVEVVAALLALWAVYRLLDTAFQMVLSRLYRPEVAVRLHAEVRRLLIFSGGWLTGWLVLEAAGYRPEFVSLWITVGHLGLVVGVFILFVSRERILEPLPEAATRGMRAVRRAFVNLYYPALYASLVVALLWVAGYRTLAAVVLGRGWAVAGISLLCYLVYRSMVNAMTGALRDDQEAGETRLEALQAGQRLIGLILLVVALSLSLRALGLAEPLRASLRQPWINVGLIRITGSAIWASVVITIAALVFSRWLQALLAYRAYPRLGIASGEAYALNRLLHYTLIALAVLVVLNQLGLSPSTLALAVGGLSVGVGFGLQDIAKNVVSGIILLMGRQVRKGDLISVGERMGTVRAVNLRSTMVSTAENVDLLIPNSKLLDDTLINWTYTGSVVRTVIPFSVAYGSDMKLVMELARKVAWERAEVAETPEPEVWLMKMGDNGVEFQLLVWMDILATVRPRITTQIYLRLLQEFSERGIELPYPQRDLHLRSGVPWDALLESLAGDRPRADGSNGHDPGQENPARGSAVPRQSAGPPG